jgi:glycosyltransferase involved in cell wall biosynthesis
LPGLPGRFALFVGKLEPNKAPDRLLPILRAAGVSIPLVIAGEGSLGESLRREASRVEPQVLFAGWVEPDQALRMMHQAVAVLFPSRWEEPLSRVLLDGLGVGAVLIVEPTGGSEEMIVDGESGLVGRTVEELATALRRVATEDGLASNLRQGALRRAKEHFSKEVVLPRVENVYSRVVKGETVGE